MSTTEIAAELQTQVDNRVGDTPNGHGRNTFGSAAGGPRLPGSYTDKYTPDDKRHVAAIIKWLKAEAGKNEEVRSVAHLARGVNVSQSTAQSVLAGKWPSPPAKHLAAMLDYMSREVSRQGAMAELPFVETSVYRLVTMVCKNAHEGRDFGIVSGVVGVGKSRALKEYASRHPGTTLYIRITPAMNPVVLLQTIVEATGAAVHKQSRYGSGTKAEMLRACIAWFKGRDYLLIADEADKGHDANLEYLRAISDEAEMGVVLSGTEKLRPMVEDERGRHGQISSRVGFWPQTIHHITRADSDLIVTAALGTDNADVLDACWQMCSARARVLQKLIRQVQEARKVNKRPLSFDFIVACGQQLVGLKRRRNPLEEATL